MKRACQGVMIAIMVIEIDVAVIDRNNQFMGKEKSMAKNSWHQYSKVAPKPARTGHDGFVYDSKTEMDRYYYLKLLERAGELRDIRRQVKFELYAVGTGGIGEALNGDKKTPIMVGKKRDKTAVYTADFVYTDVKTGDEIIEDCKGYRDEGSKFRIRVFESLYACRVQIVMKDGKNWKTMP